MPPRLSKQSRDPFLTTALACGLLLCLGSCANRADPNPGNVPPAPAHYQKWAGTRIESLANLSIEALRSRQYGSVIRLETRLGAADEASEYNLHFSTDGSGAYNSYLASYDSDGIRVYTRVDIPSSPAPKDGYPVMVFVHGWEGIDAAPGFDFGYKTDSLYSRYIDAFVDAGYVVLTPGLRGHGTVNGVPAGGIEFLQTWDNGSYISPVFYAIDVLNLVDGIQSLDKVDWDNWGYKYRRLPRINTGIIHINGHSQGGDAALMALAASGENSALKNPISSGSIWSGCFGARFDQAHIYGPMASTLDAFMSGDGTWTGSAIGNDGVVNPNFVFAWPPDWIGTLDTNSPQWTWQADNWKLATVAESLQVKFSQMYDAINKNVEDIDDASFDIILLDNGKAQVRHDPRILSAMYKIGAYNSEQYLSEPLLLHHSNQDYYSIPAWNADLSARINAIGGNGKDFLYPGNTHSLLVSKHGWFSPAGTIEGFEIMVQRDLDLQTVQSEDDK
jgi:dienelactone hydrolase